MDRPKPGTFIDDLPENQYHNQAHGYSSSNLKSLLKKSPAHFKYELDQPPKPPTAAMKPGSVLHSKALKPEAFDNEIAIMPAFNLRTKQGKLDKHEFEAKSHGKLVVTEQEYETGLGMANAVLNHDEAMRHLEGSICERSMYAEILDVPLRARADSYKAGQLNELKSTRDASPEAFAKQIANLYYHVSLIHYAVLMEECVPEVELATELNFVFIVVENEPPYTVATYQACERMVETGWERWKFALSVLAEAVESGFYPGYTPTDQTFELDLPNWAVPRLKE